MSWLLRAALVGFAAVAFSIVAADVRAQTPATAVKAPVEGIIVNPCTGQLIDFSGVQHVVFRVADDETGVLRHHLVMSVIAGLRVFDPLTGETYIFNQASTYILNLYMAGNAFNLTTQITGVFVGGTSSFRSKFLLHTTVTPTGETTVTFEVFEITCM